MSQDMGAVLTTREVAELLDITQEGVRQLIKRGLLPAHKPGRDYLVYESDLEALIKKRDEKYREILERKARKKGD